MLVKYFAVALLIGVAYGFSDIQDGARITLEEKDDSNKIPDSTYSIPIRKGIQARVGEDIRRLDTDGGIPFGFDGDEFSLLSRMKTMELPPSPDAQNYYAQQKYASASSRLSVRRQARSTDSGLKFDDKSSSSSSAPKNQNSRSIPSSPVSFEGGSSKGEGGRPNQPPNGKLEPTEENKRLFPELFGLGGFGGGYYPGAGGFGGGYPYYPHHGHHGGHYPHYGGGAGYYPGAGYPGYYPGAGYPGLGGVGSSSASASASSSAGGLGGLHHRPGLYGNGYYPGGGAGYGVPPGGVAPILGAGVGPYGPGFGPGGFREDGKNGEGSKVSGSITVNGSGSASASSSDGKGNRGGVSFEG